MEINGKEVLICDCEGTMAIDAKALAKACGAGDVAVNTQLCRAQLANFERTVAAGKPAVVACTQEAPLFLEASADAKDGTKVSFTNIRERAGWSKDGAKAIPKMAALLAEAALDIPSAPAVSMESKGALLIIGKDETAIEAAKRLAGRLEVSVLLAGKPAVQPPRVMDVPVFRGTVKAASGHLGAFRIEVENFAPSRPSSRDGLAFETGAARGTSETDLILDLRGGTPLFQAPDKRDGYFNPDPGNPALVADALLKLTDMVGVFEKPRYIEYDAAICAHSRSRIVGCRRCLDVCPTGAIAPTEDKVAYDPYVCAGCGACASVCPTGAASYQLPAGNAIFERARTLLGAFRRAGGKAPVLLVHDPVHGEEMIDLIARFGDGLPARVLPFAVNQTTQIGLDFMTAAMAYGAARIVLLVPPNKGEEADPLRKEAALAETVFEGLGYGTGRILVVDDADPDAVAAKLWNLDDIALVPAGDFLPVGKKRSIMMLALSHLHANAPNPVDTVALPEGSPFGAVEVRVDGCTLCLACVGACPTGALKDNPDQPMLRFAESACVQCGLCRATCPEKVISLAPRLSFLEAARTHQTIKQEEPFHCIRCGKAFGTKASIERVTKKLEDHAMFAGTKQLDRLRMCDTCRVVAMTEDEVHPFAGTPRPIPRTTQDYLDEREELRRQAAADMAAKGLALKDDES